MRCLLSVLLLPALMQSALAQDNDPEKLFRAVEKKIKEAKAIHVVVAVDIIDATKDKGGKVKGSMLLTKDNQVNIKASGVIADVKLDYEMISDGKQMKLKPYAHVPVRKTMQPTPAYLHRELARMVTLSGVQATLLAMPFLLPVAEIDTENSGVKSPMIAWDFKAGTAEKVGGRDAKMVSFRVGPKGGDADSSRVTLWIDGETLLPRKLVFRPKNGDTITEIYNEFRLDPKIAAKDFDLPK